MTFFSQYEIDSEVYFPPGHKGRWVRERVYLQKYSHNRNKLNKNYNIFLTNYGMDEHVIKGNLNNLEV